MTASRSTEQVDGGRWHVRALSILLALFVFRVAAQIVQRFHPTPLLPPFDAWQSGTLPYGVLVAAQLLIIAAVGMVIVRMLRGDLEPRRKIGTTLLVLGGIYMAGAVFRVVAGMSFLSGIWFFRDLLPGFFHIVLAAIVLVLGHFHFAGARVHDGPASGTTASFWLLRRTAYPAVMLAAVAALWALLRAGASLSWAPYAVIAAAGLLVLGVERLLTYRQNWRPAVADFVDDGAFMLLVQILLPLALSWIVVRLAQQALSERGLVLAIWPRDWPIAAQVLLKLAAGDFLRYWLHRWSHEYALLWRLHAVHHHTPKLYATSVFRFHPADKALQFLCDSLPFILLGVGQTVLAYYFVIYATSGFFQHSNADLRLGWLNYLVSGPELHRWHHSQLVAESNHNYAHTLIVWDLVFGTYYRPRDAHVGRLGLIEQGYPARFAGQLLAPFTAWARFPDAPSR